MTASTLRPVSKQVKRLMSKGSWPLRCDILIHKGSSHIWATAQRVLRGRTDPDIWLFFTKSFSVHLRHSWRNSPPIAFTRAGQTYSSSHRLCQHRSIRKNRGSTFFVWSRLLTPPTHPTGNMKGRGISQVHIRGGFQKGLRKEYKSLSPRGMPVSLVTDTNLRLLL